VRLTRAAIHMNRHPAPWKRASGVVRCHPGKSHYTKLKAYRSISLHSGMGKVVEKVATELLSVEAESRVLLSDGTFRSRNGLSGNDSAAIMVDTAHAAWTTSLVPGMLLKDIKAAFPSMVKGRLVNLMNVMQMDGDPIQWMESILTERTVKMIIDGNAMEQHPVKAWVTHGSPVSPIHFVIHTAGLSNWVEEYLSGAEGLFFVEDHRCVVA